MFGLSFSELRMFSTGREGVSLSINFVVLQFHLVVHAERHSTTFSNIYISSYRRCMTIVMYYHYHVSPWPCIPLPFITITAYNHYHVLLACYRHFKVGVEHHILTSQWCPRIRNFISRAILHDFGGIPSHNQTKLLCLTHNKLHKLLVKFPHEPVDPPIRSPIGQGPFGAIIQRQPVPWDDARIVHIYV